MTRVPFANMLHFDVPKALKVIRTVANWHIYSLDFLGLLPFESVTLRLRNGLKFRIRPASADRPTVDEVFIRSIYDRDEVVVGENDIVLDIGAHIGTFTALASKAAKNGRVYSFEPDRGNFSLLKENLELNGISNAHAINAAVSKKSGRQRFFLDACSTSAHSIFRRHARTREITVDAVSLEDFTKAHEISRIDLLKMDCEGSEYEILLNCPKDVLGMVRRIAMECHRVPGHSTDELRILLEESGFSVRLEKIPKWPGMSMLFAQRKKPIEVSHPETSVSRAKPVKRGK